MNWMLERFVLGVEAEFRTALDHGEDQREWLRENHTRYTLASGLRVIVSRKQMWPYVAYRLVNIKTGQMIVR